MIRVSCEEVDIEINRLGFIEHWKFLDRLFEKPSYLVFFKDYSRLDPLCRHWDIEQEIDQIHIDSHTVHYSKQIESLQIGCKILVTDKGWDWRITIEGDYPLGHRFGLAIPCKAETTRFCTIEKEITTNLAQYCRSTQEIFPDQSYLDLPILTNDSDVLFSVFSNFKNDCQFFTYHDDVPFVRVTTSTSLTNEILISVRICKDENELKKNYIELYPEADVYINKWKPMLQNLRNAQQIEITYQHSSNRFETTKDEIDMEPIDESKLDEYVHLLNQELSKYPTGFLKSIGVDGLLLCENIMIRKLGKPSPSTRAYGAAAGIKGKAMSWILWDVTSPVRRYIVHHEIFHFFDNIEMVPGGRCLFTMNSSDPIEHAADLFALMMTDYMQFERISTEGTWYQKQAQRIRSSVAELFPKKSIFEDLRSIWMIQGENKTKIPFGEMPQIMDAVKFVTEPHDE